MLPHSEYVTLRRWRQRRVSRKRLVPGSHSGRFRRSVDNTSLTASDFNKHVCKRAFFRFLCFLTTPCNRVLPEMLTGPQLFKFSTCPYPEPHPSNPCSHRTSRRSILTLYSHLGVGLAIGLTPQVSPPKPCIHLSSPPIYATCPAHLSS